jgi:hypothetical protein
MWRRKVEPEKLEAAAIRWHQRLEFEAPAMSLAESQLALAAELPARRCVEEDPLSDDLPHEFLRFLKGQRIRGRLRLLAAMARNIAKCGWTVRGVLEPRGLGEIPVATAQ